MFGHKSKNILCTLLCVGFHWLTMTSGQGNECPSQWNPGNLTAGKIPQNLSSPGYPDNYTNAVTCAWRIDVPFGNLVFKALDVDLIDGETLELHILFNAQSRFDFTTSHHEFGPSDYTETPIITSIPTVYILFTSRWNMRGNGFLLQYMAEDGKDVQRKLPEYSAKGDSCPWRYYGFLKFTATKETNVIKFPEFPNGHFRDYCQWTIEAPDSGTLEITFEHYDVGEDRTCSGDCLLLYDGRTTPKSNRVAHLCGMNVGNRTYYIRSKQAQLEYYITGQNYGRRNFRLLYRIVEHPELIDDPSNAPCRSESNPFLRNATYEKQFLSSPQYPLLYDVNLKCLTRIMNQDCDAAIRVEVTFHDIESTSLCSSDSLRIYNGTMDEQEPTVNLCGKNNQTKTYDFTSSVVDVFFSTDQKPDLLFGGGFFLSYYLVDTARL